jgi:Ca2+-binding EF-hand superfamily protein
MDKEIEVQRESLFMHENFRSIELFKLIDHDNKGYITADDLRNLAQHYNLDFLSAED